MSKSREEVSKEVVRIVSEQFGVETDKVFPTASFIEDLGADSLDSVELVMEFEEVFDIRIPDEEADKITTVDSAVEKVFNELSKPKE